MRIITIHVFQLNRNNGDFLLDTLTQAVRRKYRNVEEKDGVLTVYVGDISCRFKIDSVNGFFTLTSTIEYGGHYELENMLHNVLRLFDSSNLLSSIPSLGMLSTFITFISPTESEDSAIALVEEYSHHLSKPKMGVGVIRGCLFSVFEPGDELFNRYYLLSPISLPSEVAEKNLVEILDYIRYLAVYTAELSKLYIDCKKLFSIFQSREMEVREKTRDFLWKLIGPKPIDLETLASWLNYIMERALTLSTMIAAMQANFVEAELTVSKLKSIFKKLNEKKFKDYPRNFDIDIEVYDRVVKVFKSHIVKGEALKAHLETVMDEIRVYLRFQQQRIALEEQKASKEQLIRLVDLQKIFHKIELFIVAVYMTEMARIIFEVIAHEVATILTALFIPVAFLLAMGVSRLLHRRKI